jgi:hypothetical protein
MTIASSLKSSWFPERPPPSPGIGACGRFRALWALSRGALGSGRAIPCRPPPPASPPLPGSSSSPLRAGLAGSQARVSRRAARRQRGGGGGAGAGRAARTRGRCRGPPSSRAEPGGESRLAPPLRRPPQSCCLPRGRTVL